MVNDNNVWTITKWWFSALSKFCDGTDQNWELPPNELLTFGVVFNDVFTKAYELYKNKPMVNNPELRFLWFVWLSISPANRDKIITDENIDLITSARENFHNHPAVHEHMLTFENRFYWADTNLFGVYVMQCKPENIKSNLWDSVKC